MSRTPIQIVKPDEYWRKWGTELRTLKAVKELHSAPRAPLRPGHVVVYRGQADATWPLLSSLHRALPKDPGTVTEEDLDSATASQLDAARAALPWLSAAGDMQSLALLQHYGAPTRLLDVTADVRVALAFAVTPEPFEHLSNHDPSHVSIFRFEAKDLKETGNREEIEAFLDTADNSIERIGVYMPEPVDGRIAAQRAAFLYGRMPSAADYAPNKSRPRRLPEAGSGNLTLKEHRALTSLRVSANTHKRRRHPKSSLLVYRIPIHLRVAIREWLSAEGFDLKALYPDLMGAAAMSHRWW